MTVGTGGQIDSALSLDASDSSSISISPLVLLAASSVSWFSSSAACIIRAWRVCVGDVIEVSESSSLLATCSFEGSMVIEGVVAAVELVVVLGLVSGGVRGAVRVVMAVPTVSIGTLPSAILSSIGMSLPIKLRFGVSAENFGGLISARLSEMKLLKRTDKVLLTFCLLLSS